jgi:polyhydroxybutyrate depolymerase
MTARSISFVLLSLSAAACGSSQNSGSSSGTGGTFFGSGGDTSFNGGAGGVATGGDTFAGTGGSDQGTGGTPFGSSGGTDAGDASAKAMDSGTDASTDASADASSGADASARSDAGNAKPDSGTHLDAGAPDSGIKGDWRAGDYPPDITAQTYLTISGVKGQGTNVRQYKVHVPPGYDPRVPTPIVFCIHGLGQDAVLFCVTGAGLNTASDKDGFIMVMPNGYQNSWNAGTCCGGASTSQLDDVSLFRAIFAEVDKHLNIDHHRVYATGLSNGAYMSYRLACEASDLFVAVAAGAGAIGINSIGGGTNATSDFTTCAPTHPVSILDIHGTSDPLIPYSLQAPTLALAVANDHCGTTSTTALEPSGGDTKCITYPDCASGTEVSACSITGGGHCWFGSSDCGTGAGPLGAIIVGANSNFMVNNDVIWNFLKRHSR